MQAQRKATVVFSFAGLLVAVFLTVFVSQTAAQEEAAAPEAEGQEAVGQEAIGEGAGQAEPTAAQALEVQNAAPGPDSAATGEVTDDEAIVGAATADEAIAETVASDSPEAVEGDAPGNGEEAAPPAQAPDDAETDEEAPAQEAEDDPFLGLSPEHVPELTVRVEGEDVVTGSVVTLTVEAVALAADDLSVPDEQDVAPFEILSADARVQEGGARATHIFTLELLALEPGVHTIAPISVRVLTAEGDVQTFETEPVQIEVGSLVGNEPDAQPQPPTDPVVVMEDDPTLYWALGILLVVLLTALLTWLAARMWRRREVAAAPPPPPRPPEEIAIEKLNALRGQRDRMLEEGRGVEFVDAVSDAVREYLGHRFGFDGLESTTDEVLAHLKGRAVRGVTMPEIAGLLGDCDLVKFAKADFTKEQSDLLLQGSFRIVRRTSAAYAPSAAGAQEAAPTAANRADAPPANKVSAQARPAEDARWMPPGLDGSDEASASSPQSPEQGALAKPSADAAPPLAQPSPADTAVDHAPFGATEKPSPETSRWAPPASVDTTPSAPVDVAANASFEDAAQTAPVQSASSEPTRPIPDTWPPPAPGEATANDPVAAEQVADETTVDNRPIPDTWPPADGSKPEGTP